MRKQIQIDFMHIPGISMNTIHYTNLLNEFRVEFPVSQYSGSKATYILFISMQEGKQNKHLAPRMR